MFFLFYPFLQPKNHKANVDARVWCIVIYNPLINFRAFFGYFKLRGCKLQFESSFIVRPFITQVNSGHFNLYLQLGLTARTQFL